MSDSRLRLHRRNSIFIKLTFVMVAMATAILLTISGFLFFIITPTVGRSLDRVTTEYMKLLLDENPDIERLKSITERLDLDVRCEGPAGTWATQQLPSITAVKKANESLLSQQLSLGQQYHIISRPNGNVYLIAWRYHSQIREAHDRVVLLLLCSVLGVVFIAHVILRRTLQPIDWLYHGFARLGHGDFETTVPRRTTDELGVLTDAFNHMVGRVREMVKSREQLLLDVSHELRSPLTRMKVALALTDENDQKAGLLANVVEMEAMVTELLELERLKSGSGLRIEAFNLVELVRSVVSPLVERAPGVQITAASTNITVDADPEKVGVVLRNLLENALKHSTAACQPVKVFVVENTHDVLVRIDDDGAGIPEEDLPRIFEPFFRVDRSRSRRTGGYGLGLSLCQRIMQAHGGTITSENRAQGGASFCVNFPKHSSHSE